MAVEIQSFTGAAALQYLDDLAKLRMEVFRDFPYLYDGDADYEAQYLRTLANAPDSVIVVALDDNKVIGASTGMPMANETSEVQKPFIEHHYNIEEIFYFGESVLQKNYRGQGIGIEFFKHREAHARRLNRFEWLTFCGVVRPEDHPLRPKDYVPLDNFWKKRGFVPTNMICYMEWKDLDEAEESVKPLRFWLKKLS
ncbi:MAG: GNAT family N-acetyltransferase [Saprospiraceae bacterium]